MQTMFPLQHEVLWTPSGSDVVAATGISLKTQELFLIVFCTRYLDLFTRFIGLYNSTMKVS
jgi:hypothetical protein